MLKGASQGEPRHYKVPKPWFHRRAAAQPDRQGRKLRTPGGKAESRLEVWAAVPHLRPSGVRPPLPPSRAPLPARRSPVQGRFGGQHYAVTPELVPVHHSRLPHDGQRYSLRLRFAAGLVGPCIAACRTRPREIEVDPRGRTSRAARSTLDSPDVTTMTRPRGRSRDASPTRCPPAVPLPARLRRAVPVWSGTSTSRPHEHVRIRTRAGRSYYRAQLE